MPIERSFKGFWKYFLQDTGTRPYLVFLSFIYCIFFPAAWGVEQYNPTYTLGIDIAWATLVLGAILTAMLLYSFFKYRNYTK